MRQFDYTENDIVRSLKKVGVKKNDIILCHSDVQKFGVPKCGLNKTKIVKMFFRSFFKILGDNGTLVFPTFTYSFCHNEIYNPKKNCSLCGFISNNIKVIKKFKIYPDPNLSFVIYGKHKNYLSTLVDKNSYGKNSLFAKFFDLKGKICNLNLNAGSTFLHFLERKLNVNYRFDKKFKGKIIKNGKAIKDKFTIFSLYKNIKKESNFEKFTQYAIKKNYYKQSNLGRGKIGLINSVNCYKILEEKIKNDKNFLLI
jgi:aminoglycoside 3-N-acetyltransferase